MKIYSFLKKAYNKLCYIFKEIYVSAHLRAYYRETKALVGIKDEKIDCDYCEIVVVAFNNAKVIEYQIRTLQKYFRTPYRYTVFDNSTDTQVAKTIREVCQQYGIGYVRLPKQSFLSGGQEVSHTV